MARIVETKALTYEELLQKMSLMQEEISSLKSYTKKLECERDRYKHDWERLVDEIRLKNARYFGARTDKVIPSQLSLFNDIEAVAEDDTEENTSPKRPKRARKPYKTRDLSRLPRVVIEHTLEGKDLICKTCSSKMEDMTVEVTERLRYIPAHFEVEEHRRHVYVCKTCSESSAKTGDETSPVIRAPYPSSPIKGSIATPSLISHIIHSKYALSLPLYRMEKDFEATSRDVNITRQTMAKWVTDVCERWLFKVYAKMVEDMRLRDVLYADETVVQVLKEPNRTPTSLSRMWLVASKEKEHPSFIYHYAPTRSQDVIKDLTLGFKGYLHSDGYPAYLSLGDDVVNVACLAHVRRKFIDLIKADATSLEGHVSDTLCKKAISAIDEMFAIDASLSCEPCVRYEQRLCDLAPKMKAFFAWLKENADKPYPKSALDRAMKYALKMWPYVMNVLKDGRLELTNNFAERAIKPFVIGRKNWLFSDTQKGAHASACLYSLVVSARENSLDSRAYIEYLLDEMPKAKDLDDDAFLTSLLPWSDDLPRYLCIKKDEVEDARKIQDDPIYYPDIVEMDRLERFEYGYVAYLDEKEGSDIS